MVNYNDLPTFKHKKEVDKYVYYESEDRYLEIEKIRKSRCRVYFIIILKRSMHLFIKLISVWLPDISLFGPDMQARYEFLKYLQ